MISKKCQNGNKSQHLVTLAYLYLDSVDVALVDGLLGGCGDEDVALLVHQVVLVAGVSLSLGETGDGTLLGTPAARNFRIQ